LLFCLLLSHSAALKSDFSAFCRSNSSLPVKKVKTRNIKKSAANLKTGFSMVHIIIQNNLK
jgi:hypothetical protein